jgi:hypothetical protein
MNHVRKQEEVEMYLASGKNRLCHGFLFNVLLLECSLTSTEKPCLLSKSAPIFGAFKSAEIPLPLYVILFNKLVQVKIPRANRIIERKLLITCSHRT